MCVIEILKCIYSNNSDNTVANEKKSWTGHSTTKDIQIADENEKCQINMWRNVYILDSKQSAPIHINI